MTTRAEAIERLYDAAINAVSNSRVQPDAQMNGSTDCYAVPRDDIEALRFVLEDIQALPPDSEPTGPVAENEMNATETFGSTEWWPLLDRIIAWLDRLDADSAARGYPDTAGIGLQPHHFETGRLTLGDLRAIRRLVREGAISHHDRDPDIIAEIAAERGRQVTQEGWTLEHDDGHENGEMAAAAACYAIGSQIETTKRGRNSVTAIVHSQIWPWGDKWWKPKTRRRNLIRAAALLIAEIERLDRARDGEIARDVKDVADV